MPEMPSEVKSVKPEQCKTTIGLFANRIYSLLTFKESGLE